MRGHILDSEQDQKKRKKGKSLFNQPAEAKPAGIPEVIDKRAAQADHRRSQMSERGTRHPSEVARKRVCRRRTREGRIELKKFDKTEVGGRLMRGFRMRDLYWGAERRLWGGELKFTSLFPRVLKPPFHRSMITEMINWEENRRVGGEHSGA